MYKKTSVYKSFLVIVDSIWSGLRVVRASLLPWKVHVYRYTSVIFSPVIRGHQMWFVHNDSAVILTLQIASIGIPDGRRVKPRVMTGGLGVDRAMQQCIVNRDMLLSSWL